MINGSICYAGPLWHVAYCAPRAEQRACEDIGEELGFETFLPMEHCTEVYRGRKVKVARPLFPRYLFTKVDPYREDWQEVLGIADVINVLMAGEDIPAHVPTASIEALRKAEQVGIFDRTTRFPSDFAIGETIRIGDGQFSGHTGVIAEFTARMRSATAHKRAKLLIAFMGRMITLDVPATSLEKV